MLYHLLILVLLYAVIEVEIKIKMTRKPIIRRRSVVSSRDSDLW